MTGKKRARSFQVRVLIATRLGVREASPAYCGGDGRGHAGSGPSTRPCRPEQSRGSPQSGPCTASDPWWCGQTSPSSERTPASRPACLSVSGQRVCCVSKRIAVRTRQAGLRADERRGLPTLRHRARRRVQVRAPAIRRHSQLGRRGLGGCRGRVRLTTAALRLRKLERATLRLRKLGRAALRLRKLGRAALRLRKLGRRTTALGLKVLGRVWVLRTLGGRLGRGQNGRCCRLHR